VIIDRLDRLDKDCETESDGFVSLRKLAQRQSVSITRTGAEDGLSAPISLESLKSQSLSLSRSDITTQDVDVTRVSLAIAVQFIVSLEVRQELANPRLKDELPPGHYQSMSIRKDLKRMVRSSAIPRRGPMTL
jgi:hypothetical protein